MKRKPKFAPTLATELKWRFKGLPMPHPSKDMPYDLYSYVVLVWLGAPYYVAHSAHDRPFSFARYSFKSKDWLIESRSGGTPVIIAWAYITEPKLSNKNKQ